MKKMQFAVTGGNSPFITEESIQSLLADTQYVKIELYGKDIVFCVTKLTNGAVMAGKPCIAEQGQRSDGVMQQVAYSNTTAKIGEMHSYLKEAGIE